MLRHVLGVSLLTLIYLAALASFDPIDIGIGLVLAMVLTRRFGEFVFRAPAVPLGDLPRRAAAVLPLAWAVLRGVHMGSWQVARAVLSRRLPTRPGIIEVILEDAEPAGLTVCSLLVTLSPGSLVVDLDVERRAILLHVLDAGDPDAARREVVEFYRRHQRRVVP